MPVPPVRITACTAALPQASRTIRATSAGSSRTMAEAATRWPAPVSRSRMSAPLVSVASVFVSETVRTKQLTEAGALALCSRGVAAGSIIRLPSPRSRRAAIRAVEHLHDVQDLHGQGLVAQAGLDLEDAAGIGGHHRLRARALDVTDLARQQ